MQFLHQNFELEHKNTFYSPLNESDVLYIEIYPSYICNYKCGFCYVRERHKNDTNIFMSRNKILSVLDSIDKSRYKVNLIILGGEPTLYPYLNDILSRKYYKTTLISNGSKDLSKFLLNSDNEVTLSYYPNYCTDQTVFINNMKYLYKKNIQTTINIMKLNEKKDTKIIVDLACEFNMPIEITPIIYKGKIINSNVEFFSHDDEIFYYNGKKLNNFEVECQKIDFTNWHCMQNFLMIEANGNIDIGCDVCNDNIFKNPNFFKNYEIFDKICVKGKCSFDSYLSQHKYKDEI